MYALSLATEGHLGCKDSQPLAIATIGHLCAMAEEIVIVEEEDQDKKKNRTAFIYNNNLGQRQMEDEEIVLFIKSFMTCQSKDV